MTTIEENIASTDYNKKEFICYKFYTDIMGYNWKVFNTVEDYINGKPDLNSLQNIHFLFQKIDLKSGNIVRDIFQSFADMDYLEVDSQNNVTLSRKCIYNTTPYCAHHLDPDAILRHESQTIKKSYFLNSHNVEYIFKNSVMTDELLKINASTNNVESKILLTNKVSDIPEQYFNNLPTGFITLITKQKIAIREVNINENDPFVVYVVNK
jgi:hypothetical protein